jgi:hypothetical protein
VICEVALGTWQYLTAKSEAITMGMYDEVWWEAELPEGHPATSRLFQTKSLDRCFDRYIVTREGRFCLVGNGW